MLGASLRTAWSYAGSHQSDRGLVVVVGAVDCEDNRCSSRWYGVAACGSPGDPQWLTGRKVWMARPSAQAIPKATPSSTVKRHVIPGRSPGVVSCREPRDTASAPLWTGCGHSEPGQVVCRFGHGPRTPVDRAWGEVSAIESESVRSTRLPGCKWSAAPP